jgi:YbbR domain-containing protein
MIGLLRWIIRNFSTLLLSFVLAVVVWVSAVVNVDPNVRNQLGRQVTIELIGDDPGMRIMNDYPRTVSLTLVAPQSVWNLLNSDPSTIQAWVDLSGLTEGEYNLPVKINIKHSLVQLIDQNPKEITIRREKIISRSIPVEIRVNGTPPLGYQADPVILDPAEVLVTGPESLVQRVQSLQGQIDITGAIESVTRLVGISALDESARVVNGISLNPSSITVTAPVRLLGGYRNVIVKVVTIGIVASGYRLTNYLVSPSSVIVFSSDPRLVEQLPGYVETKPLDLSGADDDFEILLELDLPEGIIAATDSKVLVQVSIAAIETSLTISLPIEITGLLPGLEARIAPGTVDVILSGPVPILNDLQPSDIRVIVNLENYQVGTHQLIPIIDFLPAEVKRVSILPATVEVTISVSPTATPTSFFLQPGAANQTPTLTPTQPSEP